MKYFTDYKFTETLSTYYLPNIIYNAYGNLLIYDIY